MSSSDSRDNHDDIYHHHSNSEQLKDAGKLDYLRNLKLICSGRLLEDTNSFRCVKVTAPNHNLFTFVVLIAINYFVQFVAAKRSNARQMFALSHSGILLIVALNAYETLETLRKVDLHFNSACNCFFVCFVFLKITSFISTYLSIYVT